MTETYSFFTTKEIILVGTIFVLVGLVFLLFVYAVFLRLIKNRRDAYYRTKSERWEQTLLEYLTVPDTVVTQEIMDVEPEDWLVFGEFIEQYLVDLAGEDYDSIIELLYTVDFHSMLVYALDKSDEWETTYAIYLLGVMKYQKAEVLLMKYIVSQSSVVSMVAFEALQKTGSRKNIDRVIKAVLNSDFFSSTKVSEIILGYGDSILPLLVSLLVDISIHEKGRRVILDVLAERNAVMALPVILKLAHENKSVEIQIGCIKALGKFGGPESTSFLSFSLSSPNWIIRSQAVKAIGNITSPLIVPELAMRLQVDENYWVKLYSAEAMKNFGDRGRNELESVLSRHRDDELSNIIQFVLYES